MTDMNKQQQDAFAKGKMQYAAVRNRWRPLIVPAVLAALILIAVLAWRWGWGGTEEASSSPVYEVRRGDLRIEVVESGEIKARNPVEITCGVEGSTTIVSIVAEGSLITADDVAAGKVIVEFDSSELKERLAQQEISFYSAEATLTEAQKSYEIQLKQNESDVETAKLKVQFARLDLRKYVGEQAASELLTHTEAGIPRDIIAAILANPEKLGGESYKRRQELTNQITIVNEEVAQARNRLDWTRRLYEKEYVTKTELEGDELSVKAKEINVEQAQMSLDLYVRYELPKETERLVSDYEESLRALDRTQKQAEAQLAQREARLKSAEAEYRVQQDRLDKYRKQLENCIVKAPSPGLVVYYKENWRDEPLTVGSQVRERQKIMSLPSASEMAVEAKVHETQMSRIQPGQTATIVVDAFPDHVFTGRVNTISQLPDQQRWFMNPDLKVYATEVTIEGNNLLLKSGMSAKVTILVQELDGVLTVPLQAVVTRGGQKVCYVETMNGAKKVPVQTGAFNDSFTVITSGLEEGQNVLLAPPREIETDAGKQPRQVPVKTESAPEKAAGERPDLQPESTPAFGPMPGQTMPSGQMPPPGQAPAQMAPPAEGTMPSEAVPGGQQRPRRPRRGGEGGQGERSGQNPSPPAQNTEP